MRRLLAYLLIATTLRAQVPITINTASVVNSAPAHFGMNQCTETPYDSGQCLKNILASGQTPGHEKFQIQREWQINTGATPLSTTQVSTNAVNAQYDAVAANYWVGATIKIMDPTQTGSAAVLCTSTVTANTVAATTGSVGPTYTFSPACAAAPVAGNFIILNFTTAVAPTQCSGSGSCSNETSDLCTNCGAQAMTMDGTAGAVSYTVTMDANVDGTNVNDFILVNGGTWTCQQQMKLVSGSGTPTWVLKRGSTTLGSGTYSPTSSWGAVSGTFTPTETGTGTPSQLNYILTVPSGTKVYMDNDDCERTSGGDSTNTTIFSDGYVAAMRAWYANGSGTTQGAGRYGPLPNSSPASDMALANSFAHVVTNQGINSYGPGFQMPGWNDFFKLAQVVGFNPWTFAPMSWLDADMTTMIDCFAGVSCATNWSAVFSEMDVELGNECWNGIFVGQCLGYRAGSDVYTDYMGRAHALIVAARARMATDGISNVKFITGVQTANTANSTQIGLAHPDYVAMNGYTQVTVSDYTTNALLFTPFSAQSYDMTHDSSNQDNFYQSYASYTGYNVCGSSGTANCPVIVYEENMQPVFGTITQAAVDGFVNGGMSGVMAGLQYLFNLQHGLPFQNFYGSGQYVNNDLSLNQHGFGAVVDFGGATSVLNGMAYSPRPSFLGGQLVNTCNIGKMVATSIASPDTFSVATNNNGVNAQSGVPYEYAFTFVNAAGTQGCTVVANVDLTNSHAVSFSGGPANGSTVSLLQLAPSALTSLNEATSLNATNATAATVTLTSSSLTGFSTASQTIPAHSLQAYTYSLTAGTSSGPVLSGTAVVTGTARVQ